MVIVLMGVAGSGKTTIGRALAAELGWRFIDADELHPPHSVEKMRAGIPLDERDHAPWIARVHAIAELALSRREPIVIACSALKERYRHSIRGGLHPVRFVYLKAAESALYHRLGNRTSPASGPAILASQIAQLEEPADDEAVTVDASGAPERILGSIRREFGV